MNESDEMDINRYVPHSGPMSLLDRVLALSDDWLEAEVTIRPDSTFCDGHAVGGWVGLEYLAQGIAAYAGMRAHKQGTNVKIGFLVGTREYKCSLPSFSVGDHLIIRVEHEYEADNGLSVFNCRMRKNEKEVASATITVFQPADPTEFLRGESA